MATPNRPTSSRSKREQILASATDHFGRRGYEDTRWADVATSVGIGSTALYHYFESKLHCLFVIMEEALEAFRGQFGEITARNDDFLEALVELVIASYDLSEQEVNRGRVLVAEQGRVGVPRQSPREEEARQAARARTRDLELAWATFLARGMQQGVIPEADPHLMTRASLGLYNSVWHWCRSGGALAVEDVADFYIPRQLAVLGAPADAYVPEAAKAGRRTSLSG